MVEATKNNTSSKQILEKFQHVKADGEKCYVIDAAPAYRTLNISDETNIGAVARCLNPFTDLKIEDFKDTFTANVCVNG